MDDPGITIKTAELVRNLYPHMKIIARARNRQHVHRLVDLDASPVRETFYSSLNEPPHPGRPRFEPGPGPMRASTASRPTTSRYSPPNTRCTATRPRS